jgi:hypothetical protein
VANQRAAEHRHANWPKAGAADSRTRGSRGRILAGMAASLGEATLKKQSAILGKDEQFPRCVAAERFRFGVVGIQLNYSARYSACAHDIPAMFVSATSAAKR